jgi:cytochrome c oxidase assembly protein subunit 15
LLGGLRVVLFQDKLGIFHATLAQVFLLLLCAIALVTSRWWQARASDTIWAVSSRFRRAVLVATCLILGQLILGATMRHQHAGLAIPDFPLAYGKLWPAMSAEAVAHYNQQRIEAAGENAITAFQIGLQMVHRLVAVAIVALVGTIAVWSWREGRGKNAVRVWAFSWLGLIVSQILLGAATIWSNKAADIATAHVLVGATSLVFGGLLTLALYRSRLETAPRAAAVADGEALEQAVAWVK